MQTARIFLILQLLFPLWGLGGFSYAQSLTSTAKISLITVSPGKELYSSFGHSALWVSDPVQGIDKVYNYGTFDFRTEGFYLKFLRGTLPYQLSVSPMYYTMYGAQAENRSVTEQVLNLSTAQRQRLYDFLENNYLPQNRQYAYKFYYDNCSTRLRDALRAACGDSLVYLNQPIDGTFEARSFRSWMNLYLREKPWAKFGMNLAIGAPSDQIATPQQEMYLPNNLLKHFDRAKLGGKPLVASKTKLFKPTEITSDSHSFTDILLRPNIIFALVAAIILLYQRYQRHQRSKSFLLDKIFFSIIGLAGWILLLLWIATDHGVTAWNPDLLWIVPFHFPLVFFLGKPKHHSWLKMYISVCFWAALIAVGLGLVGALLKKSEWVTLFDGLWLLFVIVFRLSFVKERLNYWA
jgi:uncharacterized membrane protein